MRCTTHRRRRNLFAGPLLEPLPPISPPAAFMLCSSCKPLVSSLHRLSVRPVASAFARGADHTGNMPAATQDKPGFATGKLGDAPGRFPGNNVVLLGSHCIDVLVNLAKIDGNPFEDNLARLDEIIFQVCIAQVE